MNWEMKLRMATPSSQKIVMSLLEEYSEPNPTSKIDWDTPLHSLRERTGFLVTPAEISPYFVANVLKVVLVVSQNSKKKGSFWDLT